MDLIVLADVNGVVDMTQEAISHRTRIPLREVKIYLNMLQEPDTRSRTPDHDGRRIKLLDEHRDWGWLVVNYDAFRRIADEETRRSKTKDRVAKFRNNIRAGARASTGEHGRARASTGEHDGARASTGEHDGARRSTENTTADNQHVAKAGNPPVTPCNAGNAMQKQKQKQKQMKEDSSGADAPVGGGKNSTEGGTASKSPPEVPSAKRQLTDAWCAAFKTAHGWAYRFNGVLDGRAADRLLKSGVSIPELIQIAKQAWKHPTGFYSKQAATLAGFDSKYNEIRKELAARGPASSRTARQQTYEDLNHNL